ncbi:phage baseplate assembly protein V [Sorangium sp. So ce131]|uniref:phage baseplate assembly protein V n=1 Tax=Sorangium sp. So ce131 TaxID=3133282 RepID=UPI003F5FB0C3
MTEDGPRYYGLYRATVVNNVDPLQKGRIQVIVLGPGGPLPSTWAMPCMPFAGTQSGVYVVPTIGAGVWIQFEKGDPDYPVWIGGWWGSAAEVPTMALAGNPASPSIVLQTTGQNSIVISDIPGPAGGIMLRVGGSSVLINQTGISLIAPKVEITAATINLTGVTDVNQGALKVT